MLSLTLDPLRNCEVTTKPEFHFSAESKLQSDIQMVFGESASKIRASNWKPLSMKLAKYQLFHRLSIYLIDSQLERWHNLKITATSSLKISS